GLIEAEDVPGVPPIRDRAKRRAGIGRHPLITVARWREEALPAPALLPSRRGNQRALPLECCGIREVPREGDRPLRPFRRAPFRLCPRSSGGGLPFRELADALLGVSR